MNCFGLNIVRQIHWISVLYVSPYRHTVGNVWAMREYVVIFDSRYNNTAVVSDIFVLTLLMCDFQHQQEFIFILCQRDSTCYLDSFVVSTRRICSLLMERDHHHHTHTRTHTHTHPTPAARLCHSLFTLV